MKNLLIKTLVISFVFFLTASPVFAQIINIWDGTTCQGASGGPEGSCNFCDALVVARNIINFLWQIAFGLATIFITFGAVLIMVSGANEKWYERGKSSVTSAIIGLAIALSSWLIVNTVLNTLVTGELSGAWSNPACSG